MIEQFRISNFEFRIPRPFNLKRGWAGEKFEIRNSKFEI